MLHQREDSLMLAGTAGVALEGSIATGHLSAAIKEFTRHVDCV
jgi:hypothetical protein